MVRAIHDGHGRHLAIRVRSVERLEGIKLRNSPIAPIFREPLVDDNQSAQNGVAAATSDVETNRLNGMVEELTLSLEQANKRIHRLQGERSQLTTQLEKRDQQIQELNRELGAYSNSGGRRRHSREPQTTFSGISTTFFASVTEKISTWFSGMQGEARPGLPGIEPALKENGKAPLIAHLTKGNPRPVVVVLLLGLEATELDQLLQSVEKQCASQGAMPLCVVDCDAFEHLRSRSLAFEYVPPAADRDRFDSTLHWDLYLQRRLALIRRKWRPIRTIAFGKTASDVLALWSSSPFEDSELPSMTGQMSAQFE
jgi:hypothetical protein